jgi:hypothetical protein
MRKRSSAIWLSWVPVTSVAVAIGVVYAAGPPAHSVRKMIVANYAQIDAAISRRNLAEALSFCTPDFIQMGTDSIPETLSQVRLEAKLEAKSITAAQNQTQVLRLVQVQDAVIATIRQTMRVSTARAHMSETEMERDTWIETVRGWRLHRTVVLSESVGQ